MIDSQGTFSDANKIPTGAPNKGELGSNRWYSTNILLYLKNSARQGHSYYGMLIGTRMLISEWHYFQWPVILAASSETSGV